MSSKTTITNRPSHRLFAVTKAEGQDKASWLEIGAAWPNKDGKGFSLKLKALPMPGAEIARSLQRRQPVPDVTAHP